MKEEIVLSSLLQKALDLVGDGFQSKPMNGLYLANALLTQA